MQEQTLAEITKALCDQELRGGVVVTPPAALSIPVVRNSTDLINVLVRIGRQHPRRWALEDIQLAMKPAAHQSFQAMPEERRRSPRHPLGRVAAIMFGGGEEHPCLVKDYSDGGVRLQLTGFELPEAVQVAQQEFDNRLSETLEGMADRMEGKTPDAKESLEGSLERLEQTIRICSSEEPQAVLARFQTFLPLSRRIESLASALDKEI